MAKGKLIVLEGTDGAGKSTQIDEIKKFLEEKQLKYEYLHFPKYGHNEFSDVIAAYLRGEYGDINEVDPYFVANIFAMDRFLYLPTLKKQLEENDVVLLDRYVFSSMAYQAAKFEFDNVKSEEIQSWISEFEFSFLNLPYPDLTIFLDVPIDIAADRLSVKREGEDRRYLKGKSDIHEMDKDFQIRVYDVYKSLNGSRNYHIVKTTGVSGDHGDTWMTVLTPEEIFAGYKNLIESITNGL